MMDLPTIRHGHLIALLVLAGCSDRRQPAPQVAVSSVVSATAAPTSVAAAAPDASSPALSGPIVVQGYPHVVSNGMNDPAEVVGFTADDSEFGYCASIGARDPASSFCETVLRDGSTTKRSSDNSAGDFVAKQQRDLDAFIKTSGMTHTSGTGMSVSAPPITGTWAYPDITVHVLRVAATLATDGTVEHPAFLRVGGALGGEGPVYPVSLVTKAFNGGAHFVAMNGLALSHDGTELGMVGHFFACEWCDDWTVKRMKTGAFASLVYNDTGMRHHKKSEWAKAAELFSRATLADPEAKLPPYNLACAYARLGDDEHARAALAPAIRLDPSAKTRARADADFATARTKPWFVALTARD